MDKQGVSMDMWTSSQNAQLDHITTLPTHTYPQGLAFGLTRFACQQPFKSNTQNTEYQDQTQRSLNQKRLANSSIIFEGFIEMAPTKNSKLYSHQFVVRKFTVMSSSRIPSKMQRNSHR
jgi:hypothetical protein